MSLIPILDRQERPLYWLRWYILRSQRMGSSGGAGYNQSRWHIVPGPPRQKYALGPGNIQALCGSTISHEMERCPVSSPDAWPPLFEEPRICVRCLKGLASILPSD